MTRGTIPIYDYIAKGCQRHCDGDPGLCVTPRACQISHDAEALFQSTKETKRSLLRIAVVVAVLLISVLAFVRSIL